MPRPVPRMTTDEELEDFVAQDLSDLDFRQFKPMPFELGSKDARVNMRIPRRQLDRLKAEALRQGVPYQRLMRELLERGLHDLQQD